MLVGVAASPGVAVGNVLQVRHEQLRVVENANDARLERQALDAALEQAKAELDALQARLRQEGAGGKAAIFAAQRELLDDPDLLEIAADALSHGKSAAFGWQVAFTRHADRLASLKNELLAARANDLRDVGRRVLQKLTGVEVETVTYEADTILVAEELTPSDTASLNRENVLGLCTTTGGTSSHVAILARSLEIPLVAGIDPRGARSRERHAGDPRRHQGHAAPEPVDCGHRPHPPAPGRSGSRAQRRSGAGARAGDDARRPPRRGGGQHRRAGRRAAGRSRSVPRRSACCDRSSCSCTGRPLRPRRSSTPSTATSRARSGRGRRLVVRTLDVGGDKPLPYLPLPREDNPFLGERGIRVMLNRPELLRTQLRAILGAARDGSVAVMFPMIATLDEWRAARAILEEERQRLDAPRIEAGIMVEVPSAALLADQFATRGGLLFDRHQRPHPVHAGDGSRSSPARAAGGRVVARRPASDRADGRAPHAQHGRWTGVCGGIAGDPQAVPLLVGLGVDELSVSVPAIPAVKAQIRRLRLEECRALARGPPSTARPRRTCARWCR